MEPASPWYRDGLRFTCTECGHCCTTSGYVWVSPRESRRLAEHLGMELDVFGRRYLRRVHGRYALIDRSDGACIFWHEGCKVYPARPDQCRTFPFWKENIGDLEAWRETGRACEGVGQGRLYKLGEIEQLADGEGATASNPDPADLECDSDRLD